MSENHTRGPWVIFADQGRSVAVMPAGRRGDICLLDEARPQPESNANARLIAAAPDLLEALGELSMLVEAILCGDYTPDSFTTQPARTAIAKATDQ